MTFRAGQAAMRTIQLVARAVVIESVDFERTVSVTCVARLSGELTAVRVVLGVAVHARFAQPDLEPGRRD